MGVVDFSVNRKVLKILELCREYFFAEKKSCNGKIRKLFTKYISNSCDKVDYFIKELPKIKDELILDLDMFYRCDPSCNSKEEIVLAYPGFYAIFCYRIAHRIFLLDLKTTARMISEYAHSKTGIDIHPGARIGQSFFIDHGTGVVIGETSIIGNRVRIYHGVTLGALSLSKGNKLKGIKRHPTIEDGVVIYSNSAILGGDTVIGKGTTISNGLTIVSSIDKNKIVVSKCHQIYIVDKNKIES